jgi:transcriptional regulator with XRE-family HTH domain
MDALSKKVQKATPRQKVKCSDIRQATILSQASIGSSNRDIARSIGLSETYVSRVLRSEDSQMALALVIENLNLTLNASLPKLLSKALANLEKCLDEPHVAFNSRLKAVELVLQTTTRLSELSLRAQARS